MNYRIVSDSSSNVLKIDAPVDYRTVPLKILIGEEEYPDELGLDLEKLVTKIESSQKNSTSCPNEGEWLDAFEGADTIFALTISSQLSGSYSTAMMAKETFLEQHPNAKVHVFDTLATGGTMELMTEKIIECAEAGMDFDQIIQAVEEYRKHTHILFSLESLKNLAKNGRLNPTIASIAQLLGIRFLGKGSEKGTIQQVRISKGAKKALSVLYDQILQLGFRGGKLRISQCLNIEAANKLKEMILQVFPNSDIKINSCGALCSYYAERGGMIACFDDLTKTV